MNRHFLMLRLGAKDGECAFLMRNGGFEQVLGSRRHRLFDPLRGLAVELQQVVRAEFPAERHAARKAVRPDLAAEMFEAVETKPDEDSIVSIQGRVFWKFAPRHLALMAEC